MIVVGAPFDDYNNVDAGSAHVFRRNGVAWSHEQRLVASFGTVAEWFGLSVSHSCDTILVGAPDDNEDGFNGGSCNVFRWNGWSWIRRQRLGAADLGPFDSFGGSVSIFGDTALVGNAFHDHAGSDSGAGNAFRWSGSSWVETGELLASDGAAGNRFGTSVVVSGGTAVVGAPNLLGSVALGSAYAFQRRGSSWPEVRKLQASDGIAGNRFGHAVSLDGSIAVIGATGDDDNGRDSGSAYIFVICDDFDGDGVCNSDDACPNTSPGVSVDATGRPLAGFDGDCDTDVSDFKVFVRGLTGPTAP